MKTWKSAEETVDVLQMLHMRFSADVPELSEGVPGLSNAQACCLGHALRILQDRRAVLLCEPTGTGKTYIAAGLADYCLNHGIAHAVWVVAPAHLASLWQGVMKRFHVPFRFFSYQAASLGRIPTGSAETLFLLDEAHYLKNAHTRRYRHLRTILRTKRICLISATPIAMGYRDLESLMRLCGLPEDFVPTVTELRLFSMSLMPRYFGRPLTVDMPAGGAEHRVKHLHYTNVSLVNAFVSEIQNAAWPVFGEDGMGASGLIPRLLLHRFMSHPESCRITLRKLRRYYAQCLRTGALRPVTRTEFRRMFGLDGIQLPLPFWLPDAPSPSKDTFHAVQRINTVLSHLLSWLDAIMAEGDPHLAALREILDASPQPTVIFTQYGDTARHVASLLRHVYPTACLTASDATVNGYAVDRELIKNMFDPDGELPEAWQALGLGVPHILVATDTLATGHNLQIASRMIHLDIPWNPATVRQREGRILRHHQTARQILFFRLELADIQAVSDFLNVFWARFEERRELQETWTAKVTLTGTQTFLFSPVRQNPGFWLLCRHQWLPIYPFCVSGLRRGTSGPLIAMLQAHVHPSEKFSRRLLSDLRCQRFKRDLAPLLDEVRKVLEMTYVWPQLVPSKNLDPSGLRGAVMELHALSPPRGLYETAWCLTP